MLGGNEVFKFLEGIFDVVLHGSNKFMFVVVPL